MNTLPDLQPDVLVESERLELMTEVDPGAAARTVASFLNSDGGTLVIGVHEEHGVTRIAGVEKPEAIAEAIRAAIRDHIVPHAAVTINVVEAEKGKSLVVVDVPRGVERPYLFDDRIYVRRGSRTDVASPSEILHVVESREGADRWERRPALGASLDDLDLDEVKQTARGARERRLVEFGTDPAEILDVLNLTSGDQVRNSAVVLFGRNPSRLFPQTRLRVARFEDESGAKYLDNRVFEGGAFDLVDRAWEFLTTHVPVRARISGDHLTRVEAPAYPALAMREAVVNALVHRDYASYSGSIAISLYPSRLEIWNPGGLPEGVALHDLRRGSVSRPRNPDIAYVFFLRGFVERLGTGTLRIAEECHQAGLPTPQWTEIGGGLRLSLFLRDPASTGLVDLNERTLALLADLAPGETIGASDYQERYAAGVTERTSRSDLKLLVELGFLDRLGQGRGSRYLRTTREAP